MNIILIGMRGSGKTAVGKFLSKKTGFELVECDNLLEKSAGATIPEYIAQNGWAKFRDLESKIIADVSKRDNTILSTGGGVVENEINIAKFKSNNNDVIIWLKCSIDKIIERIGNDKSRPFLLNLTNFADDLRNVYKTRKKLYKKYADITVLSEENVQTITKNIIGKLKRKNLL